MRQRLYVPVEHRGREPRRRPGPRDRRRLPPGGAVDFSVTKDADTTVLDSGSVAADDDGAFEFIVDVGAETGDFLVSVTCGGNTQVLGFSIAVAAAEGGGGRPAPDR